MLMASTSFATSFRWPALLIDQGPNLRISMKSFFARGGNEDMNVRDVLCVEGCCNGHMHRIPAGRQHQWTKVQIFVFP